VVLWRENEVAQDDSRVGRSLGTKTSSREQGPDFDIVGTLLKVVAREVRKTARATCCQVLSPAGCTSIRIVATLSDMSDCLLIAVIS
jgi:hypothetical protein